MTTDTQKIPEGYKQTEIGVIPEDWDIKRCGELGSFYKGRGISSKDLVSDGLPCIMYGDIYVKFETKFSNPDFRITTNTAAKSAKAKTGDLFFTGSGETAEEIGKCVVYQGNENIYIGGDIIALTPNEDIDSLFLAYIQNSKILLSQKANLGQGYTVVHIYTEHIKSLKIPIPPTKNEQTTIAKVLFDVDSLIEKIESLIEKKKCIKQGTMQELLTGKRRLPGFSGRWENETLGKLAKIYQPQTISQDKFSVEGYLVYGANGVVGKYPKYNHEKWQTTITCRGSTCGTVNKTIDKCWITGNAMVMNVDQNNLIDKLFFYYLLSKQDFSNCITGSGQPQIIREPLSLFEVFYPEDKMEQAAIANIFSDMDAEIEKLEAQLVKYKNIKQGMMQNLLTGRIRLIKK